MPSLDVHDIPAYFLSVDGPHLASLQNGSKPAVPATILVGSETYQIELAYRGAHTRKFPKKSYQITVTSSQPFDGSREFHLNAEYADPSLIRNKLSFCFFDQIGSLAPRAQHVILYLNGKCAGLYLKLESVDEHFLTSRGLPWGPIYYAVNSQANFSLLHPRTEEVKGELEAGYLRKCGKETDDGLLRELIYKINTTPQQQFAKEISRILDVENYLSWLAGAVCTQNHDGFLHNYALYWRHHQALIIPWDYDATWGRSINGKPLDPAALPIDGHNSLSARILAVPAFRSRYAAILKQILEKTFTVDHWRAFILHLHASLRPHLSNDPYKKDTLSIFDDEPAFIFSFIERRSAFLRKNLELLSER
ncbi:CotH kinase family protein [Brevibacillus brevis]|uniref:CotH kinase family protein n=1 Tax=Brevibacillus brevis TaxID=1393 RepID=A0ABY9T949_BREBE|nr:CotH kinase family protein [Brevibacillus brevis]WNC16615.1 CotH kinase family protein [Brevibacillus brevis]